MTTQGSWRKPLHICAAAFRIWYPQISSFTTETEKTPSILVEYTPENSSIAPTTVIILELWHLATLWETTIMLNNNSLNMVMVSIANWNRATSLQVSGRVLNLLHIFTDLRFKPVHFFPNFKLPIVNVNDLQTNFKHIAFNTQGFLSHQWCHTCFTTSLLAAFLLITVCSQTASLVTSIVLGDCCYYCIFGDSQMWPKHTPVNPPQWTISVNDPAH